MNVLEIRLLRAARERFARCRPPKTFATPSEEFQRELASYFCAADATAIEEAVSRHYDGRRVTVAFDSSAVQFPMSCAWSCSPGGIPCFTFPRFVPGLRVNTVVERWLALMELFLAYEEARHPGGHVLVNMNDAGLEPGLAFCGNSPEYTLIPDHAFLTSRGYAKERRYFERSQLSWANRSARVFWRGTPIPRRGAALGDIPRVRLCQIANAGPIDMFDVGLVETFEIPRSDNEELSAMGLMKDRVTWKTLGNYRFHVDIDGNASTYAGLFRKLLSGGLVLKVASPDEYAQWYYGRLKPWKNFVPVRSDLSDLLEVTAYCRAHEELSRRIAQNGRALALSLTFEREFAAALEAMKAAFCGPTRVR